MSAAVFIVPFSNTLVVGNIVNPELMSQLELSCAKADIEHFLSFAERSTGNLYRKVTAIGYSSEVAEKVVEWAKEFNLVNDIRFCRLFIASKVFGARRLELELLQKGVPKAVISSCLANFSDSANKQELVKIVKRKYGSLIDNEKARRRAYQFLSRRGFSPDLIYSVLKEAL